MSFKPMLSATLERVEQLRFPVIVSPKLDGIRCIIRNGVAVSRNLKPIRNQHVQLELRAPRLEGLDGELIVGSPTQGLVLNRTQAGIMSVAGQPEFKFHAFDYALDPKAPFTARINHVDTVKHPRLQLVPQLYCKDITKFLELESMYLTQGYEGIMIRDPDGLYKYGRSTLSERHLIKFKRFSDSEGTVEGISQGVTNTNELTRDALGHGTRSLRAEGLVPSGMAGTLHVRDLKTKQLLDVSPGRMTHDERRYYWSNQKELLGKVVNYKWFDYNVMDRPRFATFQSFRVTETTGELV